MSAIPLAGACTILGGGDDSSPAAPTSNADAGSPTFYSSKPDSGSHATTARDGGTSDGGSTSIDFDGGATTTRVDGGGSTGGSGGDPQCATLSACCATLPPGPGWADTCNEEVGFGNDTECGSLYGTYQTDGYCNGNPGGLSDNCYALSQCCESLTGADLTSCNSYVSGNVDGTCQDVLTSYEDQALCD